MEKHKLLNEVGGDCQQRTNNPTLTLLTYTCESRVVRSFHFGRLSLFRPYTVDEPNFRSHPNSTPNIACHHETQQPHNLNSFHGEHHSHPPYPEVTVSSHYPRPPPILLLEAQPARYTPLPLVLCHHRSARVKSDWIQFGPQSAPNI